MAYIWPQIPKFSKFSKIRKIHKFSKILKILNNLKILADLKSIPVLKKNGKMAIKSTIPKKENKYLVKGFVKNSRIKNSTVKIIKEIETNKINIINVKSVISSVVLGKNDFFWFIDPVSTDGLASKLVSEYCSSIIFIFCFFQYRAFHIVNVFTR